jgi:hypothetical protein
MFALGNWSVWTSCWLASGATVPAILEARIKCAELGLDLKWQAQRRMAGEMRKHPDGSDSNIVLRRGFMTFAARSGAVLGSISVNYLAPE